MAVRTVKVTGAQISTHIKDTEWQCSDGTKTIKYDTNELAMLEKLRTYVGSDNLTIDSGYRTESYNTSIGGSTGSMHCLGYAADVRLYKNGVQIPTIVICCLAQDLGFKGIAICRGTGINTHLDMRASGTYRGDERINYHGNNFGYNNDFYAYAEGKFNLTKAKIQSYIAGTTTTTNTTEEEEEMTQSQFNTMMDTYLTQLKEEDPADWSLEERTWAEDNGIIKGDTDGKKEYKAYCTREQMVVFLYRLFNKIKG